MPTLYIIRGASGSGKTTYAQWLQDEGRIYDYHEADRYFQNPFLGTPYKFDPSKLKDAHAWCQKCVENDMKLYRHVAVSNTFTKWWRNHREQDRKRQEAEDEKRTLKKIAGDALRKLNVEDMEALKFIGVTFPSNMKKALKS